MKKFVKNLEKHRWRLDELETSLLFALSQSKEFSQLCQIEFRYLDGSFPDSSDVALALVSLIEKDLVRVVEEND